MLVNKLVERAFDAEVRVSHILHVQGALVDTDAPSDAMRDFIEEDLLDAVPNLKSAWPELETRLSKISEDGEAPESFEVCHVLLTQCPFKFLVCMEMASARCTKADPSGARLGSWTGGWGCYMRRWYGVDRINDAIRAAIKDQNKRRTKSWRKAIDEGRVYAAQEA